MWVHVSTIFLVLHLYNLSGHVTQLTEDRKESIISVYLIQMVGFHGYSPVAERGFLPAVYKNDIWILW